LIKASLASYRSPVSRGSPHGGRGGSSRLRRLRRRKVGISKSSTPIRLSCSSLASMESLDNG